MGQSKIKKDTINVKNLGNSSIQCFKKNITNNIKKGFINASKFLSFILDHRCSTF